VIEEMVRPERFELPTLWFVARCSIQLSYGRDSLPPVEILIIAEISLLMKEWTGLRLDDADHFTRIGPKYYLSRHFNSPLASLMPSLSPT
jgi:hypothetical protein